MAKREKFYRLTTTPKHTSLYVEDRQGERVLAVKFLFERGPQFALTNQQRAEVRRAVEELVMKWNNVSQS